jgi:type VI secretion system protein ImpK
MTLLELCEPLFQYVARLSRLARMGQSVEMNQVRSDITKLLAEVKQNAASTADLAPQYDKIELPLIFFVDFMVKESNLTFSYDWIEFGRERNELAGDEKFFDLLDETLADPSEAATQRLAVYYTCLGLGFFGIYAGQPESILGLMSKITPRISSMMDADETSIICPAAYENVDSRDFIQPPGTKLVGIGIALIGLLLFWSVAWLFLFITTSSGVDNAADAIIRSQGVSLPENGPSQDNNN